MNDVAENARDKARQWAAFDKPVLARQLDKCADEIGRLRAALAEIRARAPTMNNGGAWAGGLAARCLMSKNEQSVSKEG